MRRKPLSVSVLTVTALSVLHMLVDFACAFSLYGIFYRAADAGKAALIYNFCAFALQMPFGVLLDGINKRRGNTKAGVAFTALGVVLTFTGTFTSYAVLGIGNALFHVGGGVLTIREDDLRQWKGKGLGVFVAPGAIGLFAGSILGGTVPAAAVLMLAACAGAGGLSLLAGLRSDTEDSPAVLENNSGGFRPEPGWVTVLAGCFAVVILRSFVGLAMNFSWKTTWLAGLASVLFVAGGKAAGGFVFAKYPRVKAEILTLVIAGVLFVFSSNAALGMLALFFFNMTMPLTLYMLKEKMPDTPGLAFGILTFGLFLGYLPLSAGWVSSQNPAWIGSAGCALSLAVFLWMWYSAKGRA